MYRFEVKNEFGKWDCFAAFKTIDDAEAYNDAHQQWPGSVGDDWRITYRGRVLASGHIR